MEVPRLYTLLADKANDVENELRSLNRWDGQPLPAEKFEDMGAFGSNKMTFEQWLQFVLIPRINDIVSNQGDLPSESMLAAYAVRAFDGDPQASRLIELLHEIDQLINVGPSETQQNTFSTPPTMEGPSKVNETISLGDDTIPPVLHSLAKVLPQLEGDDLESQLQTFDIFLGILNPSVRPAVSELLIKAATASTNMVSKERITAAARSVAQGGKAAEPYYG